MLEDTDYEENAEYLVDSLPTYYPKEEEGSNYKLLKVIANRFDESEEYTKNLRQATTVQNADTSEQLKKHSERVNLKQREGEGLEKFRARTIAQHQLLTCEGTPLDIIQSVAEIINGKIDGIHYTEYRGDNEMIVVGMPSQLLDEHELSEEEISEEVNKLTPAGYELTPFVRGTFEIAGKSTYENNEHDPSKAVSSLNEDGEPIDEYGTISTTIG